MVAKQHLALCSLTQCNTLLSTTWPLRPAQGPECCSLFPACPRCTLRYGAFSRIHGNVGSQASLDGIPGLEPCRKAANQYTAARSLVNREDDSQ